MLLTSSLCRGCVWKGLLGSYASDVYCSRFFEVAGPNALEQAVLHSLLQFRCTLQSKDWLL